MDLSDDQLERYARHVILKEVGGAGQQKLLAARVLIVGAGGLGAPLALYLAAAGVGTLGIADDDVVSLSNLQRQVIHATAAIGDLKTDSAARTLATVNPDVQVEGHSVRLTAENAAALIGAYDIVADGSDNFDTRFLIADTAAALGKTLVSAAIGQFDGQLSTWKPFAKDAKGQPYPCHRCLFPAPPPPGTIRNCAEAGVLGAVAGVMGTLQAVEVIKEILGLPDTMAGRFLVYDALATSFRTVKVPRDPACAACGEPISA